MLRPLLPIMAFTLWLSPASAMQAGASAGRINVSPDVMAGHCITMVSPNYPQGAGDIPPGSFVVVRVVVSRLGNVSPVRAISGPQVLQSEAMNAVRLWRYRPFVRDDQPLDVTTDVRVEFNPGKPGGIVSHPNH